MKHVIREALWDFLKKKKQTVDRKVLAYFKKMVGKHFSITHKVHDMDLGGDEYSGEFTLLSVEPLDQFECMVFTIDKWNIKHPEREVWIRLDGEAGKSILNKAFKFKYFKSMKVMVKVMKVDGPSGPNSVVYWTDGT